MRVAVVGATGNVGSSLLGALLADPRVSEVVAIARRVPDIELPGVTWHAADISRDPLDVIAGTDAVVHLAWKIQPQHHTDELFDTNITGLQRLVETVTRHRVPRLVYASSVGTYAPAPKSPRADESWPATGIPTSVYSRHKAMAESLLDVVEADHPWLAIVRMRTSLVFQRRAASEVHRLFLGALAPHRLPGALRVLPRDPRLSFQATHADDIAQAYLLATVGDARGPFNIAAEPVLTPAALAQVTHARLAPVPLRLLRAAAAITWRAHLQPSEEGWLDMAMRTPIMSTRRARDELGWAPRVSATDALAELLRGIADRAGGPTAPLHPGRHGPVEPIGLATV